MTKVECEDGKYTFICHDGEIKILRFHQPWLHSMCNGDGNVFPSKAIMALISQCQEQDNKITQQENKIKELEQQLSYYRDGATE